MLTDWEKERQIEAERASRLQADRDADVPAFNIKNTSGVIRSYWHGQNANVLPGQTVEVPPRERARMLRLSEEITAAGPQVHGRTGDPLPPPFVITSEYAQTTEDIIKAEEARLEALDRRKG